MGATDMVGAAVFPRLEKPLVNVTGLQKSYGRQPAVRGVDLQIDAGEIYGLIGPDGAGKSSLM